MYPSSSLCTFIVMSLCSLRGIIKHSTMVIHTAAIATSARNLKSRRLVVCLGSTDVGVGSTGAVGAGAGGASNDSCDSGGVSEARAVGNAVNAIAAPLSSAHVGVIDDTGASPSTLLSFSRRLVSIYTPFRKIVQKHQRSKKGA